MSRLPVPSSLRRARRAVLARRRPLAALCAALAVLATVQANAAGPPPRTLVVTAAHDLGAGVVLASDDLRLTAFDPDSVPSGVVSRAAVAVGRTTTGPVRAGEPLTDARLVTTSLLAGYPGLAAVPVRIGDAGAVRLLRVGDRVTLLAADPQGEGSAAVVGRDVPVLAIPQPTDDSPGTTSGALVVVGLPVDAVRRGGGGLGVVIPLGGADRLAWRLSELGPGPAIASSHSSSGRDMLKGFKDFIMRGNLVELAVAFIIGGAFATVVATFTAVLMGFVGKIGGNPDFGTVTLAGVNVGLFINAVIAFLVVAAVIYFFVVTPYNRMQAAMARGDEATPPAPDIALLTEIRDLLADRPGTSNVHGGGGLT